MRSKPSAILRLSAIIVGAMLCGFTGQNDAALLKWEKFDFATQVIKPAELQALKLEELKLLRGIVFGKHGRIFREQEIQNYLYDRAWYKPNEKFTNALLTNTERKNLDLIREMEAKRHKQVEPGDLRFYQDRVISKEMLGKHTLAELHIMQSEIEAIHGKRFDDEPNLQEYFEERYWYRPGEKYEASVLTPIERQNLALLAAAQKEQRHLKLAPGDMISFQNRPVSEELLRGLSLYELRLLRNEIYARRGRQFRTFWLQDYFYSQDWYKPLEDFREPALSEIEKKNIATIVAYENRIHEELSSKPVTRDLLEGIFLEDASKLRNEIYARRGKVFKDKWLQRYFASFPWYRANPQFTEALLTSVEKQNVATIQAYEKDAVSVFRLVEG